MTISRCWMFGDWREFGGDERMKDDEEERVGGQDRWLESRLVVLSRDVDGTSNAWWGAV